MKLNLKGKKFGKWIVIKELEKVNNTVRTWLCRCECGVEKRVRQPHLRSGRSKGCVSCGNTKHGLWKHELYETWLSMKDRCNNPNNSSYQWYGKRGIKVCDDWNNDFSVFLNDMRERPKGYTLDRIDNNKGYSVDNCRWVDPSTQAFNKRNKGGISGVTFCKSAGKWRSRITFKKQEIPLGFFKIKKDAIKARKEAELKYFGFSLQMDDDTGLLESAEDEHYEEEY